MPLLTTFSGFFIILEKTKKSKFFPWLKNCHMGPPSSGSLHCIHVCLLFFRSPSPPADRRPSTRVLRAWNESAHTAHSHTSLRTLLKCYSSERFFLTTPLSPLSSYPTWFYLYALIHGQYILFIVCLLPLQCRLHGGKGFVLFTFLQRALIPGVWHRWQTH